MIDTPQVVQASLQQTAVIPLIVSRNEIQNVMGPAIQEVLAIVAAQGLSPNGPCFTHHFKRPTDVFDFEVGFPVETPVTAAGRVIASQLPQTTVARTVYHGPYEGLAEAWCEFLSWIKSEQHQTAGYPWECYLVGPEAEKDPSKWRTELNLQLI